MKMTSTAEEIASRCLRTILAPISVGSTITDSDEFSTFQSALEHVIRSALEGEYPWWRGESLDAFRFAVARKLGIGEAEFIGLCLLISDQTWAAMHLRLRVAAQSDKFEWLECSLGESGTGNGGMVRTPYGSSRETKMLYSVVNKPCFYSMGIHDHARVTPAWRLTKRCSRQTARRDCLEFATVCPRGLRLNVKSLGGSLYRQVNIYG